MKLAVSLVETMNLAVSQVETMNLAALLEAISAGYVHIHSTMVTW